MQNSNHNPCSSNKTSMPKVVPAQAILPKATDVDGHVTVRFRPARQCRENDIFVTVPN